MIAEIKARWGDGKDRFLIRVMAAVFAPSLFAAIAIGPLIALYALFASLISVWLVFLIPLREMS